MSLLCGRAAHIDKTRLSVFQGRVDGVIRLVATALALWRSGSGLTGPAVRRSQEGGRYRQTRREIQEREHVKMLLLFSRTAASRQGNGKTLQAPCCATVGAIAIPAEKLEFVPALPDTLWQDPCAASFA